MPTTPHRGARALAALALLVSAAPAAGQTAAQVRRETDAVTVIERLGAAVPAGASFTDADGRRVEVRELLGAPVLLSFNYTGCPKLCELQLAGLSRALRELGWRGEGFRVVTVSLDPDEQLPQLRRYRDARVAQAGGGEGIASAWRFLVGAPEQVAALAEAVGVRYRYDAASGTWAHQATLVALTPDGRVSAYHHGISYDAAALRATLARASGGAVATPEEQRGVGGFVLACLGLDPSDPAPLALRIMRVAGAGGALLVLSFLGVHAVREARRRREASP